MKMDNMTVKIPELKILPNSLLVDKTELASGKSFSSTRVKTYLLFGAENNPLPIPCKVHATRIRLSGIRSTKKNMTDDAHMNIIAKPDIILESILFESLPDKPDAPIMIIGAIRRIKLIIISSTFKIYCKCSDSAVMVIVVVK